MIINTFFITVQYRHQPASTSDQVVDYTNLKDEGSGKLELTTDLLLEKRRSCDCSLYFVIKLRGCSGVKVDN